jgi:hypothetical protein
MRLEFRFVEQGVIYLPIYSKSNVEVTVDLADTRDEIRVPLTW